MKPTVKIIVSDALEALKKLPDESVHVICTSPPYFQLRDYNVEGQIGLESTPEKFVEKLVEVFREARRVLRHDGTCWINMGDKHASTWSCNRISRVGNGSPKMDERKDTTGNGIKTKDLIGIPWMLAFALRSDGWYLRTEIIWEKKNSMPESIEDRPSRCHEYIFLLSKRPKYFYDKEAVKQPSSVNSHSRASRYLEVAKNGSRSGVNPKAKTYYKEPGKNSRIHKTRDIEHAHKTPRSRSNESYSAAVAGLATKRNLRSIWSISSSSYKGAHFACVDESTECLTTHGWKKWNEINQGDFAAQFDFEKGTLSWAQIKQVFHYKVENEPMIETVSRDMNLLLTPNHRTVVKVRHKKTRKWKCPTIIRADALKTYHSILVAANFDSCFKDINGDWAELIGWYLAEGYEPKNSWSVEIYQSRSANPEKVDRIRHLLNSVGAVFEEAHSQRVQYDKLRTMATFQIKGFAAAKLRQMCPKKAFPDGVLSWSHGALTRLLDGLIDGDGHRRNDGRFSFIQKGYHTAGMVQAIGIRLGYSTKITRRSKIGKDFAVYFTKKKEISLRGTKGKGAIIQTRPYSGVVWCPEMPLGTWVARKNGRSFITGNTFPKRLALIPILAGTSPHGCCAACGAPYKRILKNGKADLAHQILCGGNKENGEYNGNATKEFELAGAQNASDTKRRILAGMVEKITVGWEKTCHKKCECTEVIPCTVMDIFCGSGTSMEVAFENGRSSIGIELNPEYAKLIEKRLCSITPLLFVK